MFSSSISQTKIGCTFSSVSYVSVEPGEIRNVSKFICFFVWGNFPFHHFSNWTVCNKNAFTTVKPPVSGHPRDRGWKKSIEVFKALEEVFLSLLKYHLLLYYPWKGCWMLLFYCTVNILGRLKCLGTDLDASLACSSASRRCSRNQSLLEPIPYGRELGPAHRGYVYITSFPRSLCIFVCQCSTS